MRYYDIDVLRFLAALAVMFMHYMVRGFSPEDKYFVGVFYGDIALWMRYNWLAVNVFFSISGFVVLMSAGHGDPRKFIISRITRLYPAYWFCCVVAFAVGSIYLNDILRLSWARFLLNLTMFNGLVGIGYIDNVYWTLWVEMRFYILILVLLYFRAIDKIGYALGVWMVLAVLQLFLTGDALDNWLAVRYAPFFVLGCVMYQVSRSSYSLGRIAAIVLSVIVGALHEIRHLDSRTQNLGVQYESWHIWLITAGTALVFAAMIERRNFPGWYRSLAAVLGSLSYPIYLFHWNVGFSIYRKFGDSLGRWEVLLLASTVILAGAIFIHYCIEKPLSKWLKRRLEGWRWLEVNAVPRGHG